MNRVPDPVHRGLDPPPYPPPLPPPPYMLVVDMVFQLVYPYGYFQVQQFINSSAVGPETEKPQLDNNIDCVRVCILDPVHTSTVAHGFNYLSRKFIGEIHSHP